MRYDAFLGLKIPAAELATIESQAERSGKSTSAFVRDLIAASMRDNRHRPDGQTSKPAQTGAK